MIEKTTAQQHQVYERIHSTSDFQELRQRYRGFAFPATVAFMVWYLLFVISANWLPGLMTASVGGNINVAFVFGILQFVSTFAIAWLYARHATRKLDPIADKLASDYQKEAGAAAAGEQEEVAK
ncbi:MAG: DUF485 domain-containing protein [Micromonosporaceae bacterium]